MNKPQEWRSPGDDIAWRWSPWLNRWIGQAGGIEGTYIRTIDAFRKAYPEAPAWDGWTEEK